MSSSNQSTRFTDYLQQTPFFQVLSSDQLTWITTQAKCRQFNKKQTIFLEGDVPQGLYWLETGWLKAVKRSGQGREQILQFFEAGDTFHELGAFSQQPNPATVIALTPASVWLIPRSAMTQLMKEDPSFATHLLSILAQRLHYLVSLVADLSLRPVIVRLAQLILDSEIDGSLQRPSWYTQSELAARLGTVPDVIQRTLRGLEVDGLITVERRIIYITNGASLK